MLLILPALHPYIYSYCLSIEWPSFAHSFLLVPDRSFKAQLKCHQVSPSLKQAFLSGFPKHLAFTSVSALVKQNSHWSYLQTWLPLEGHARFFQMGWEVYSFTSIAPQCLAQSKLNTLLMNWTSLSVITQWFLGHQCAMSLRATPRPGQFCWLCPW